MKNHPLLQFFSVLVLSTSSFAQVISTRHLEEPALTEGQCHTVSGSKVYLKDIHTSSNKTIVEELGAEFISQIQNTETESYFFCKIKCHINSEDSFIWTTRKDRNENFKYMNGFLCPGLDVQDVPVSPTLTIKTTVATPYYAVQSEFPEVHSLLRALNYKVTGPALGKMVVDFYTNLAAIQTAYSYAQSPMFQEASALLAQYTPTGPESWENAKTKAIEIETSNAPKKESLLDYTKGSDLVDLFFLTSGKFLRYVD